MAHVTPSTFGRIVVGIAYFACALVIGLGYVVYRQHQQLQATCRYAVASTSPVYVHRILQEVPWCR